MLVKWFRCGNTEPPTNPRQRLMLAGPFSFMIMTFWAFQILGVVGQCLSIETLLVPQTRTRSLFVHLQMRTDHNADSELFQTVYFTSGSCLLLPLMPALVPPVTALFPVSAILLAVTSESITSAHGKSSGCQTVREVDLRADGVGEVRYDENVLDVVVAVIVSIDFNMRRLLQRTSRAQCLAGRPWVPG